MRAVAAVAAALMLVCTASAAASASPTRHDRTLVRRLVTELNTFKSVASPSFDDKALKGCSYLKTHPQQAFALFVVVPALVVNLVGEHKAELLHVRGTLAAMHPDSPLFRQWLTAQIGNFDLLLRFDNGGRHVDLCKAVTVLASQNATAAQVHALLGIDPTLVPKLFQTSSSGPSARLAKLNPRMRSFFIAAGMTPKQARALTS